MLGICKPPLGGRGQTKIKMSPWERLILFRKLASMECASRGKLCNLDNTYTIILSISLCGLKIYFRIDYQTQN
jgi:hypothetical protein